MFPDLPGILSGSGIGFIDPHERHLKNRAGKATSCKLWNLKDKSDQEELSRYSDQFVPFFLKFFDSSIQTLNSGIYKDKTLFRFPLRTKSSSKSEISDNIYTPEKVRELFRTLEKEAHDILLFLSNLSKIEVWETSSTGITKSLDIIKSQSTEKMLFTVSICVRVNRCENKEESQSKWYVSVYEDFETINFHDELSCTGSVSVAYRVNKENPTDNIVLPTGRIFCILPLPLEQNSPTGLNIHISASFILDENRRSIKWPSYKKSTTEVDKVLRWNVHIVEHLIPRALVKLTEAVAAIGQSGCSQAVYSIMPDTDHTQFYGKIIEEKFYQTIVRNESKVWFPSNTNGMHPVSFSKDILFGDANVVNLITVSIRKMVEASGTNTLVLVPKHILKALGKHNINNFRAVSSDAVVSVLKSGRFENNSLSVKDKLNLLNYILVSSDKLPADRLVGVKLLPLDDGNWIAFKQLTSSNVIYLTSPEHPQSLLPGLNRYFVRSTDVDPNMLEALRKLADQG